MSAPNNPVPPPGPEPLPAVVARTVDRAGLGGTAPVLLLELAAALGSLGDQAVRATARGRRPFRPDETWEAWLGRLGFDLYNLADQTGADLDSAIRRHAASVADAAQRSALPAEDEGWPFPAD